jgi:hypothetical protein
MLQKQAVVNGDEVYQMRKDLSPGLYSYQNSFYSDKSGEYRGLEFITTMGEQLVKNPLFAVKGDPEGFKLWLKTIRGKA